MTNRKSKNEPEIPHMKSGSSNNTNGSQKKAKPKKDKKPLTPEQKKLKRQRIVAWVLIACVSIGILGVTGVGALTVKNMKNAPALKKDDFLTQSASTIFDKNGEPIYNTAAKKSDPTTFDQVPQSLIDAFVAVEDSRFFVHGGWDVPRFTKAALSNLLDSLRHGSISFGQGGSTLTMQLIKNQYFMENEDAATGVNRKLQEIYLSTKLEREQVLSKKMIFELYINMINYGVPRTMGADASAQAYFGKRLSEINLTEAAFLAGVINAPSVNNPYYSIEAADERTKEVLYLMNYHGYITDEEYQLAKAVRVEDLLVESSASEGEMFEYQAFIDVAYQEAQELTGLDPGKVSMNIYTSMDPTVQKGIDDFQNRKITDLNPSMIDEEKNEYRPIQVGSVILNNRTGEIAGIVGGFDYNGAFLHNRAIAKNSSPASVMKPHIAYAPAFEYQGLATSHVFLDAPMNYRGTDILIGNYDGRYLGQVPLMMAVADSRNIPALEATQGTIDTIGNEKMVEYLNKLGFSSVSEDNFRPGFAIGDGTFTVSPVELAGANAVMFNDGNYIKPHTITRIEFLDSDREPYVPSHTATPVISDASAWLTTRIMKYAVDSPYNPVISPVRRNYPVFGKTGTNKYDNETADATGVPRNAIKDRLMITATSEYSIATWTGFDSKDKKNPYFIDEYGVDEASQNLTGKLNSYLLDLIEESFGTGDDVARPGSVADIQHILGTFPYQAPVEGMDQSLLATGYIKRDFLKLAEASPKDLSALSDHKVMMNQKGNKFNFDIKMATYPDASQLTVAPSTITMNYPSGGTVDGKRLYDPSWLFGAVRYKSEIRVDGKPIAESMTEGPNQEISVTIENLKGKIEACSYYTFDKSTGKKSNVVCTSVDAKEISVSVPSAGTAFNDFVEQMVASGFSRDLIQGNYVLEGNKYKSVVSADPNILGKSVKPGDYSGTTIRVNVTDLEITASGDYLRSNLKRAADAGYLTVDTQGKASGVIDSFTVDGVAMSSFRLSDHEGSEVVVNFK